MKKILVILGMIVLLIAACAPSAAQTTLLPATYMPDVNVIVAETFAAMTAQAVITQPPAVDAATSTPTLTPTITVTPTPVPGSISGVLSYPSEFIPALRVVAFSLDGFNFRYVDTMQGQETYQITGLAPGLYHVVAYILDGSYAGGYTAMVTCGLSAGCDDHSLIDVVVESGKDTPNIAPGDWYAPDGFFPPMP
jgi:hypothetical protein